MPDHALPTVSGHKPETLIERLDRHPALKAGLRRLLGPALPMLRPHLAGLGWPDDAAYRRWIDRHDTPSVAERLAMRRQIAAMPEPVLLSVAMPAWRTPPDLLRLAIGSLRAQIYPHWELCVVDDASPGEAVTAVLAEQAAADPRIRWRRRARNGHIAAATNDAIAMARGRYVVLMDHDDLLPEHALYEVAQAIERQPEVELIYSDEDKIDGHGRRHDPYFKPDFDADLLLAQNLVSHLGVYARDLLLRIGGLRDGYAGSQDHDLALRAAAATRVGGIHHIPRILYHWRQQAGSFSGRSAARCVRASRAAVQDHLTRHSPGATLQPAALAPFWHRVVHPLPRPLPSLSVLMAGPGAAAAGVALLRQLRWPALEVVAVEAEAFLAAPGLRLLAPAGRDAPPAAALNQAASAARGQLLLLLDPATEGVSLDWLRSMAAQALRPQVGAVGARLLDAEGRLLHAGYRLDPQRVVTQAQPGARADAVGHGGCLALARQVSAVSGAAMMLRRAVFEEVAGLDAAALPWALHDVDLCLRLRAQGYRILTNPAATLRRTAPELPPPLSALVTMRWRWDAVLVADPFLNPNLPRLEALRGAAPAAPPAWRKGCAA
ncbi:glycosyltransferase family 2 protein [Roseomonas sp. F4]